MTPGLLNRPDATRDEKISAGIQVGPEARADKWYPLIRDGSEMQTEPIEDPVEIVEGLLCERSKFVIGSSAKSFKTWLTLDLAVSIASGVPFLGRETQREPVGYINLELKSDTFTRRLQAVTRAKGITLGVTWFRHLPLRGQIAGLYVQEIISRLIVIAKNEGWKVLVLDPLYKLNVLGDENSSRDMTCFFNELDRLTVEAGCTVIACDHFSKGNQSDKDALDAIRGSSAKAGDVDAALILRKHEVERAFRVDVIHRELPPVEPFVIGWHFPLMEPAPDLNPDQMKLAKGGRRKTYDPLTLCAAISDTSRENPTTISAWAKGARIERTTLTGYTPTMRSKGWIQTTGEGTTARQFITEKGHQALREAGLI